MPYRVGIIGMGRIAAGFDTPEGPEVTTHLKGILSDPRLSVAAVADLDMDRAAAESARFGIASATVTPSALMDMDLHAICIATPDGTHLDYTEKALEGSARVILVEKPLEGDRARRRTILADATGQGKSVAVHHLRRWIPGLAKWISEAAAGLYGKPLSATAYYTRGMRHNGIHALDLLAAFLGTSVSVAAPSGGLITDFSADDPTLTVQLTIGSTPVLLVGVDGRTQTAFEVDIRFEQARVRIFDEAGIRAELHRSFGRMPAGFAPELRPFLNYHDAPARLLALVWSNVADYLDGIDGLACADENALRGYDLADAIAEHLQP